MEENTGAVAFERLVDLLNYPMFVVTTNSGEESSGCLVGFASQASIDPPRFFIGLSKRNHTFGVAKDADHLAVHVIPRENLELARLFGEQTGDEVNKFDHCSWHRGPHDVPILDDAVEWFVGKILQRFDAGDHAGILVEPVAGPTKAAPETQLVTFSDVQDFEPGHDA